MKSFYPFYDELCNKLKQESEIQTIFKGQLDGKKDYYSDRQIALILLLETVYVNSFILLLFFHFKSGVTYS